MGTKRCQTRSAEKRRCLRVYKPETTQNLTFSTSIFIFAVCCLYRRRRLMSNFKSDLVRGQKYFQPTGQGPGTSPDPQRRGVGQHRDFASPGSSPSLSEHPWPPPGHPSPRAVQTNQAPAVVSGVCPGSPGRDQNPPLNPTGMGALKHLEDRGHREPNISPNHRRCNGRDCPLKGAGVSKAQRAPETARNRVPKVPLTV